MTEVAELVRIWRSIIIGDWKSWVLFEHGTIVILMTPGDDLAAQATELLAEFGPVRPGSAGGDFGVIKLGSHPGWVVTGQHDDVLNYVAPEQVDGPGSSDLRIGMMGRSLRGQDAETSRIIHIEDHRKKEGSA